MQEDSLKQLLDLALRQHVKDGRMAATSQTVEEIIGMEMENLCPYIRSLSKNVYHRTPHEREDVETELVEVLVLAMPKYDPAKGSRSHFFRVCLKNRQTDMIRHLETEAGLAYRCCINESALNTDDEERMRFDFPDLTKGADYCIEAADARQCCNALIAAIGADEECAQLLDILAENAMVGGKYKSPGDVLGWDSKRLNRVFKRLKNKGTKLGLLGEFFGSSPNKESRTPQ